MSSKNDRTQQIIALMKQQDRIRNISVIAHVDHGKTTLTDSLLARAGVINAEQAGTVNYMMTKKEEQARGITIKSTGISLIMPYGQGEESEHKEDNNYLINLVDSPGHVDFSSEVTAALRITDGALLVVDCVEGVGVQTETVLRQALAERIKPVLHVNKVDRAILELQLDSEAFYQNLQRNVESVNMIMAAYELDTVMDPLKGNVSFGSGKQGWAFTLPTFARIIAKKLGKTEDQILPRLWGDWFYDPSTKKFTNSNKGSDGKPLKRYVCQMVLDPLLQVFKTIMADPFEPEKLQKILDSIGVVIPSAKVDLRGQDLLKFVLQKWIPAADALVEMMVRHLPSPKQAQQYRVETLYTGPMDDECAQAIKNCDPDGPLVMYVSKMVPSPDGKRFTSYGRVFSGTLKTGQKVRIMGPDHVHDQGNDLFVNKPIQRVTVMMGRTAETVDSCVCGNTIGIVGIDQYLLKSGTLSTHDQCWPIAPMKFSVSPVVRVAVETKNPKDLPKLVENLKLLVKTDPAIQCSTSSSGEHIVAGAGELHLDVILKDLKALMNDAELVISDPVVQFNETVSAKSNQIVLAKSQNGHNRLFVTAQPMGDDLCKAIEEKKITTSGTSDAIINERASILTKEYGWDPNHAKKIWFFAPEETKLNVFVDETSGISYLNEIKEHVLAGMGWACKEGVLCEEYVRGVRFNLVDAVLHADAVHRGAGQILPASRRVMHGAMLTAQPRLMEPIFSVEIQTTQDVLGKIHSVMGLRRGYITSEELKPGTPLYVVKGYLPVAESFGFTSLLREATSGKAFPQTVFDHYQIIDEDPFTPGKLANKLLMDVRKRRGLSLTLPTLEKYHDKL